MTRHRTINTGLSALTALTFAALLCAGPARASTERAPVQVGDTMAQGPCLVGTVTAVMSHGAYRVQWARPDTPECRPPSADELAQAHRQRLDAHADRALTRAMVTGGADAVTTAIGLASGATELNPLGPLWGNLLKVPVIAVLNRTEDPELRATRLNKASSLWAGFSVNNLCIVLVAVSGPLCPAIGLVAGVLSYQNFTATAPTLED